MKYFILIMILYFKDSVIDRNVYYWKTSNDKWIA